MLDLVVMVVVVFMVLFVLGAIFRYMGTITKELKDTYGEPLSYLLAYNAAKIRWWKLYVQAGNGTDVRMTFVIRRTRDQQRSTTGWRILTHDKKTHQRTLLTGDEFRALVNAYRNLGEDFPAGLHTPRSERPALTAIAS